mmetsp:Transcript_46878/g.84099  ORF Transcript_46878/g.84099 Transcript_46878/m.84099 type:complete len:82 (-) Transcript_46878:175-420(-)
MTNIHLISKGLFRYVETCTGPLRRRQHARPGAEELASTRRTGAVSNYLVRACLGFVRVSCQPTTETKMVDGLEGQPAIIEV